MAQTLHYKAKKAFKLDCGHMVKAGEEFVVVKIFTCDIHAATLPYQRNDKEKREQEEDMPAVAEE